MMFFNHFPKISDYFLKISRDNPEAEGCLIHPTRLDSSLVFAIRQTGNQFVSPIPSNRHKSFSLLSIWPARSWFVQDLENIAHLGFEGRLTMLSIQVMKWHESSPLLSILHARSRFARDSENIVPWTMQVELKCCRFDSIQLNWQERFSLLSIHHAVSRFAWDMTLGESSQVVNCLTGIDWSLLPHFKNEEGSCIIISRIMTSGSVDQRRANRVKS